MQLTQLKNFLPGMEQADIETVVEKAGWLSVWECEAWPEDDKSRSATYLMVYRSTLVKDTSPIYREVAAKILAAGHSEILRAALCEDETLMFGSAEALLIRLHDEGANPPYKAEDIKWLIDQMEGAML